MALDSSNKKYSGEGAGVKSGLSEQSAIKQKELRNEGQGQRPAPTTEKISSDRGTFTTKC